MSARGWVFGAALCAGVATSLAPVAAAAADADEKEACASAYESAQRYRRKAQLRASRRELLSCTRAVCPAVLSQDCTTWLREVDAALPTIVPAVRDGEGRDLVDVEVFVDGELVASRLQGVAIAIDPGPHAFRFVAKGHEPLVVNALVREGERHRPIAAAFPGEGPAAAATGRAPGSVASTDSPPAAPSRGAAPFLVGGVGLAAVAGFGYFAYSGLNKEDDLYACRPRCAGGDVDAARRDFLVADVLLGVGVVSLLAATYLYLRKPSSSGGATLQLAPSASPGGFRGALLGTF